MDRAAATRRDGAASEQRDGENTTAPVFALLTLFGTLTLAWTGLLLWGAIEIVSWLW